MARVYMCIDLKSFYASVECVERDLNPFVTFTYFEPDTKKKGGKYNIISGNVNRIDLYKKQIIVDNDNIIPIFEIIDIKLDICDF